MAILYPGVSKILPLENFAVYDNADALSHRDQPDPVETTALTRAEEFPNKIAQCQ